MINRILIRIKVVQLLYSYLLTRQDFNIEPAPVNPSRDKRSAYNTYLDTLLLILELSGCNVRPDGTNPVPEAAANRYLRNNLLVKSIVGDDRLRAAILRDPSRMDAYNAVAPQLYDRIVASSPYRSYIRRKEHDISTDAAFWSQIVNTVIAPDAAFVDALRHNGDSFTISGMEAGLRMVNDTILSYSDNRMQLIGARNALDASLDKAYQLYYALLSLIVEITRAHDLKLDAARHKYLPTDDDLNPDTRLVDNALARTLAGDGRLEEYFKEHPFSWSDDPQLIRALLDRILASDIYADYIAMPETGYKEDAEFWRSVFKNIILPSDELAEALEEKSVYWNDDLAIMGTFVLKTLRQFSIHGAEAELLPQFKDDEDRAFGPGLFMHVINNQDTYRGYIDMFLRKGTWDSDRLAFMDVVIMLTAIAELVNYPLIPVAVTMNEYIEIANAYSTNRSGQFINGILFSITRYLNDEGIINKK